MGSWAKSLFGREKFEKTGIVVAGTNNPGFERKVLKLFDELISSKDAVYHGHLVRKVRKFYPVVFNVYGAPAMVDVLTEMHDGGCRNLIFVGYAYGGFHNLPIGGIVIPDKSYHFDGIYHPLDPKRKIAFPDSKLNESLKNLFTGEKITFHTGPNISVPAVTFQMPHANGAYRRINPVTLEMETAACFSRAKDIGVRAAAILVISDNRHTGIDEAEKKDKEKQKLLVLETIVDNIATFKFADLRAKRFTINDYLASVIRDPKNRTNAYRKRK